MGCGVWPEEARFEALFPIRGRVSLVQITQMEVEKDCRALLGCLNRRGDEVREKGKGNRSAIWADWEVQSPLHCPNVTSGRSMIDMALTQLSCDCRLGEEELPQQELDETRLA